jgi:hypothetical protein
VAAIAVLVVEPAAGGLLRVQSQFSVALSALHIATAGQGQGNSDHGESLPIPES